MVLRRIYGWPEWDFRNPLEELERMRQRMDRLFEGFAGTPWKESYAGVFPLTNITEDKDKFYVRTELPGKEKSPRKMKPPGTTDVKGRLASSAG
jgi:HSP20 family protein